MERATIEFAENEVIIIEKDFDKALYSFLTKCFKVFEKENDTRVLVYDQFGNVTMKSGGICMQYIPDAKYDDEMHMDNVSFFDITKKPKGAYRLERIKRTDEMERDFREMKTALKKLGGVKETIDEDEPHIASLVSIATGKAILDSRLRYLIGFGEGEVYMNESNVIIEQSIHARDTQSIKRIAVKAVKP